MKLYQVTGDSGSGRTWNLRRSGGSVSSSGGTFNLRCEVRSGSVEGMTSLTLGDYNPSSPIPAGQVGVWAGSDSATVKFTDFRVLNMTAAAEVDGRWYDDAGDTSLASGKLQMNVVTGMGSTGIEKHALRRGFRGSKFVLEFDGPVSSSADLGAILHYQNPENFMAVVFSVEEGSSYSPLLLRRKGGVLSTIASNSPFTMTSGDRVRLAIHNDPNHAELQELKVYVNGTLRLSSDKIDDDWSGGAVGLITRNASVSASFDNVKIGFDNNANDDVDDGGDTVLVNDDFASGTITLSHDQAGNLTDDGVFQYVYDAWNRLVGVKTSEGSHATIATYSYDGLNRRIRKVVTNTGSGLVDQSDAGGVTGIQAGDKTEDYFYAGWRVLEERDGDGKTLAQTVYGTQYIDEPLCRDRNTNLSTNNDCVDSGGSQRYFYQQDANYRVVALTNESGGIVERYEYEAYGEPRIYQGAGSGSELGYLMQVSGVGNALMHQGLHRDAESRLTANRNRSFHTVIGRYLSKDPLGYRGRLNRYLYLSGQVFRRLDPLGLCDTDQNMEMKWLRAHPDSPPTTQPAGQPGVGSGNGLTPPIPPVVGTKKDPWWGYDKRPDGAEFKRWFHRNYKQKGDSDADKDDMERAYDEFQNEKQHDRDMKDKKRRMNEGEDGEDEGEDTDAAPAPNSPIVDDPTNGLGDSLADTLLTFYVIDALADLWWVPFVIAF